MKTVIYILTLCISVFLFAGSSLTEPAAGSRGSKPNIILIMADDLGQEALGC